MSLAGVIKRAFGWRGAAPIGPTSIQPLVDAFWVGGSGYTPALIERVGTASRCLQLNAQQVATMPLRFRGTYEPVWVSNPDPVWFPNGISDAVFAAMWSMYAAGDAFLWATSRYEATGYPSSWTVLDPWTMHVEADPAGGRRYRSNDVWLDSGDVVQVCRDPRGGLRGTGALQAYASNLSSAAAAEVYAVDVFAAGGIPNAVLKSQYRLDAEQAADLQAQWVSRVGARMAAPAVLPPEIDFEQLSFSPKDLMLLESREWDARQIAAAFGVPAMLLNIAITGGLVYQNPAMLADLWWRTELMPAAHRLEAALSTWLPRGNWVEFDPSVVLRPALVENATVWLSLLDKQVVTVNEVRAAVLDLPPVEDGEALDLIDEPAGASASQLTAAVAPPPMLEVVQ